MSFYVNVNYKFALDPGVQPEGGIIPAIALPKHELERRRLPGETTRAPSSRRRTAKVKHPHLTNRLFDPQLYMASLDASRSPNHCARLASYPWFGVTGLSEYDSGQHRQSEWRKTATKEVRRLWPGEPSSDPEIITNAARQCVEFQLRNGMRGIILPSPLTHDPSSTYSLELQWLDAGLVCAPESLVGERPIFATVALSDTVLYPYSDPKANPMLETILDQVTAREVDGVYIVIEQRLEADDTRDIGSERTLRSLLHLVHRFAHESRIEVGVNFVGSFGLACQAAGASWWASNWYKSLYRLRLADTLGGGRTYPLYWSAPSALFIHLEEDFDVLARSGLSRIADVTQYSKGLVEAAKVGKPAADVAEWAYQLTNNAAAMAHYARSAVQMETKYAAQDNRTSQLNFVQRWLTKCDATAKWARARLGSSPKTKIEHPAAWLAAFKAYREDHRV